MTLTEILSMPYGSVVAILVLVLSFVEFSPIKVSPLQWIGSRVNKELIDKIDRTEKKIDEHVAESYRNNIFMVQDKLLKGEKMPYEEWKKALKVCDAYDKYIEDNHLLNGEATEAIALIKRRYKSALNNNEFLKIPN